MESKKEIYDLIPSEYYPKTLLIEPTETVEAVQEKIKEAAIEFPLIAKPDIGLRGTAVKKIHNTEELAAYFSKANFNVLIQSLIPYENRNRTFLCKISLTNQVKYTGIVAKEFMILTGNGKNTIRELLHQDKRYLLQLEVLEAEYKEKLNTILSEGETINLVPYGNHCRGTKFVDASHEITPEMIESFNIICSQINGFHFGRMDIMYHSYEDLAQGKNFQIVEINGAISEPTHMYDPKHSIWFWLERTHTSFPLHVCNQQTQPKKRSKLPNLQRRNSRIQKTSEILQHHFRVLGRSLRIGLSALDLLKILRYFK